MSSALRKKKALEKAEKHLRLECAHQYGSSSAGSNTATLTTTAHPGSLTESAPSLTDDDESTNQGVETSSKGAPRVVSAHRKPKKSEGPPQTGNRGVVNNANVLFVNSIGSIIRKKVTMKKESCVFIIDFNDIKAIKWINKRAASVFREWKHDLSENHKLGGRDVILEELLHMRDEWEWLCTHFDSDKYKRRSVANSSNRGKELEHHSRRKPIIYRVAELRDKGASLPVVEMYSVTYDINQPKAVKHYLKEQVAIAKTLQSTQHPDIPPDQLPPLDWQTQLSVVQNAMGETKGSYLRGIGRASVLEKSRKSTSFPSHSQPNNEVMAEIVAARKEAVEAQERAEKAQKIAEQSAADYQLLKLQMDQIMARIGLQPMCSPSVPSQQPRDDDDDRSLDTSKISLEN
ncbi:hypothetical protein ACLB2K_071955 [Fragaria x ananassa]